MQRTMADMTISFFKDEPIDEVIKFVHDNRLGVLCNDKIIFNDGSIAAIENGELVINR